MIWSGRIHGRSPTPKQPTSATTSKRFKAVDRRCRPGFRGRRQSSWSVWIWRHPAAKRLWPKSAATMRTGNRESSASSPSGVSMARSLKPRRAQGNRRPISIGFEPGSAVIWGRHSIRRPPIGSRSSAPVMGRHGSTVIEYTIIGQIYLVDLSGRWIKGPLRSQGLKATYTSASTRMRQVTATPIGIWLQDCAIRWLSSTLN